MNKLSLVLALIICFAVTSVNAQDATTTGGPDANYGILQGKLKRSDAAIENDKKNTDSKVWFSRAEVLIDIFNLYRQYITKGSQEINIRLIIGEPTETKSWTESGSTFEEKTYKNVKITFKDGVVDSWEELNKLHEDPLPEAQRSLDKARELDTDNKLSKKMPEVYTALKKAYEIEGIEDFMAEDYKGALNCFDQIIGINELEVMGGVVDTVVIYNAGLASIKLKDYARSVKYFEMAKQHQHDEPNLYIFLKNGYFEIGDTASGVKALEAGFKRYPTDKNVLIELINYYLLADQAEEALEYLKVAKEDDPGNISFYFAEGTLYDKMGNLEKAKVAYDQCIQMDANYFNAYYNTGVMYYNKAVQMYEEANSIDAREIKKYEEAKAVADKMLANAVEPMEKAHEVDPKDCDTIDTLKTLYYRLQMTDKHKAISELSDTQCPKAVDAQ